VMVGIVPLPHPPRVAKLQRESSARVGESDVGDDESARSSLNFISLRCSVRH